MEKDYVTNIESWTNSIIELEENNYIHSQLYSQKSDTQLISLGLPTYYRSKAFLSTSSINSLINAADPLLTLATKLRKITIPPETSILHQNICHEIRAFENKAQTLGYRHSLILAARYVICALLDELISTTLCNELEWEKFNLVSYFQKDFKEEEKFFLILERSLQEAAENIDLLELIYLCLRFGYEGKYRTLDKGHLELRHLTDHLYYVINQQRDEVSRGLLISIDPYHLNQKRRKIYLHLLPPTWLISALMIIFLIIAFIFFYMKLIEIATPINQFLKTLQTTKETQVNAMNQGSY